MSILKETNHDCVWLDLSWGIRMAPCLLNKLYCGHTKVQSTRIESPGDFVWLQIQDFYMSILKETNYNCVWLHFFSGVLRLKYLPELHASLQLWSYKTSIEYLH